MPQKNTKLHFVFQFPSDARLSLASGHGAFVYAVPSAWNTFLDRFRVLRSRCNITSTTVSSEPTGNGSCCFILDLKPICLSSLWFFLWLGNYIHFLYWLWPHLFSCYRNSRKLMRYWITALRGMVSYLAVRINYLLSLGTECCVSVLRTQRENISIFPSLIFF